ncbi:MAG TPA: cytochrome c oxidase accessory protein CcoG, partial [Geminicoccaceae bacterium]|nr:cytochrome c oxidase accessory protein CcoG [Geminicoccaceae bacterium]
MATTAEDIRRSPRKRGEDDETAAPNVAVEDARSRKEYRSDPLYIGRVPVYPKRVDGTFRRIKWAVLAVLLGIYYVVPWIRWDRGPGAPDQAVLIDMPGRRAYFFWLEIWPQEVYFLAGLLILAAFGLFMVTSLFGRVWCGFTCPQTVWTDLYMWVESRIEGDRNARMRLDKQPWSRDKVLKKTAKHAAWLFIAAATGGAWIMYFNDAPTVTAEIVTGDASFAVYFFFGLFTATTYLLAGHAREQVCTYMCPWPRFQAALIDEDSLVVTYQKWRGEPRGKHRKGEPWEG